MLTKRLLLLYSPWADLNEFADEIYARKEDQFVHNLYNKHISYEMKAAEK